jgi:putative membrane protein insertion efficiency factor
MRGRKIAIGAIKAYRFLLSPFMGNQCRFHPTCSAYAIKAIEKHGLKGGALAVRRIFRCHPWYKGAMVDTVPASIDWREAFGYKRSQFNSFSKCGCVPRKEKTDE